MFLQTICGLRPEPFFSKVILRRIRNKCCVLQRKVQTFCSDPRSQSQYHLTGTLWSVSVSLKKFLSFFSFKNFFVSFFHLWTLQSRVQNYFESRKEIKSHLSLMSSVYSFFSSQFLYYLAREHFIFHLEKAIVGC